MAAVKQSFEGITKSEEDKREYRGLELTNGLKVLLESCWSLPQPRTSQPLPWTSTSGT